MKSNFHLDAWIKHDRRFVKVTHKEPTTVIWHEILLGLAILATAALMLIH